MSVEDLKIKCEIRNILVQFWVDTTKLNVSSHQGVVYFRGTLERVRKEHSLVNQVVSGKDLVKVLQNIEERLRRVRNIKRIFFDISNMKKVGSGWQKA